MPLIVLAAACAGLAYLLSRRAPAAESAAAPLPAASKSFAPEQPPAPLETLLDVEALELELGCGLARLANQDEGSELLSRIASVRRELAAELGLIIPTLRVRDSGLLQANDYVIRIRGTIIARGEAFQEQFLARGDSGAIAPIPHAARVEPPGGGTPAYWITESQLLEARRLGYTLLDAADVIAAHLAAVVRQHGHLLLSRQEVYRLVEHLKQRSPALVEQVVGPQVKLGELQKVLQGLLRRGASIRDLEQIIETLADEIHQTRDLERLTAICQEASAAPVATELDSRRKIAPCLPVH
jgi:flagellar biosynthesis protein FlhA